MSYSENYHRTDCHCYYPIVFTTRPDSSGNLVVTIKARPGYPRSQHLTCCPQCNCPFPTLYDNLITFTRKTPATCVRAQPSYQQRHPNHEVKATEEHCDEHP